MIGITFFLILFSIVFVVPLLWIIIDLKYGFRKHDREMLERRQAFKQQAHKILVNLDDCKVKHRTRYERIAPGRYDALDSRVMGIHRKDSVEKHSCTITYKTEINGKPVIFTKDVCKHEMTVYALFAQQKTTYIYVDRQDITHYYFDLEFLNW